MKTVRRVRQGALSFTVIAVLCASSAPAQTAEREFDVSVIKEADLYTRSPRLELGPNVFRTRGTLRDLIRIAYNVADYQIKGSPGWATSVTFDVQAKTEIAASSDEIREMVGRLLQKRFLLKTRWSSETMNVYALTVARPSSALKVSKGPATGAPIQIDSTMVVARAASMESLAKYLTIDLRKPVLDRTGLAGLFDFDLQFGDVKPVEGTVDSFGTLSFGLKELGLKLVSQEEKVPVLMVEGAERPTAN